MVPLHRNGYGVYSRTSPGRGIRAFRGALLVNGHPFSTSTDRRNKHFYKNRGSSALRGSNLRSIRKGAWYGGKQSTYHKFLHPGKRNNIGRARFRGGLEKSTKVCSPVNGERSPSGENPANNGDVSFNVNFGVSSSLNYAYESDADESVTRDFYDDLESNMKRTKTRRGLRSRGMKFKPYSQMSFEELKDRYLREQEKATAVLNYEIKAQEGSYTKRYKGKKSGAVCPRAPKNTTQFLIHEFGIRDEKSHALKEQRRLIRRKQLLAQHGENYHNGELTPYGFEVDDFEKMLRESPPETEPAAERSAVLPCASNLTPEVPKLVFNPATPYGFEWSSQREASGEGAAPDSETNNSVDLESVLMAETIEKKNIENLEKNVLVNLVVQLREKLEKEKQSNLSC